LQEQLHRQLEHLFLDEWGGPRSEMALTFLRQNVIPSLVYCLTTNHQLLANKTFVEIIADKLNTEFAYPPVFAEGLAADICQVAIQVLERHAEPQNHPWQPWEDIMRMLILGWSTKAVAEATGYSENYIAVLRRKYMSNDESYQSNNQMIRFIADFKSRFKIFKNYFARLHAEQVIFQYQLPVNTGELLHFLEGMYYIEKQFNKDELIQLLQKKQQGNIIGGVLVGWQRERATQFIEQLLYNHLLVTTGRYDQRLSLSHRAAQLIVPIVGPQVAKEVIDLLHSQYRDRISRSAALILGKNNEVVIHVIKELVKYQDPKVISFFKVLHRKVAKPVLLEIIDGCGEFSGSNTSIILTKALRHRDSVVRVKACQAIARQADQSYYFYLITALEDTVPLVR